MMIQTILPTARSRLVTMSDTAPVVEAAKLLHGQRTNLIVVCDIVGLMTGVVTKTDVVKQISVCTGCSCTTRVADIMTQNVIACHVDQTLLEAWSIMKGHSLKQLPICDHTARPLGLLYANDALQALWKEVEYEEMMLRDYVMGIGYR